MARLKAQRKPYRPRKGLLQAARDLGCTYSHLRRVVVGERPGVSLMKRFHEWKKTGAITPAVNATGKYLNSPKRNAPSINLPALENLSQFFFGTLQQLGIEVVIVRFKKPADGPAWDGLIIGEELGNELHAVRAGFYDSTFYDADSVLHFFHVKKLGLGMNILKKSIEARGSLHLCTIYHGESHDKLRVYYPPLEAKDQLISLNSEALSQE